MSFGTVSFNEKIYIFGSTGELLSKPIDGKDSYFFRPKKTVLIYDPQEDSWENLERNMWIRGTELPKKLLFSGIAVSDNSIFVIGGYRGNSC
jgi:N-acetylneuraminic acid mutarotase